jgi:hypothetical protein
LGVGAINDFFYFLLLIVQVQLFFLEIGCYYYLGVLFILLSSIRFLFELEERERERGETYRLASNYQTVYIAREVDKTLAYCMDVIS